MVKELERGEDFKLSPIFGVKIGQYHLQIVNFRASKKFLSIAEIDPSRKHFDPLASSVAFTYQRNYYSVELMITVWK
jgi:hypothetical protein